VKHYYCVVFLLQFYYDVKHTLNSSCYEQVSPKSRFQFVINTRVVVYSDRISRANTTYLVAG